MGYKDFFTFVAEQSNFHSTQGMETGNTHHTFGNASFQVKLLGMAGAKAELEPHGNRPLATTPIIKKGDVVDVFDLKKERSFKGRFISGKKDNRGYFTEITIIDDNNELQVLKSGHKL